jgi:hypothetical protein
VTVHAPYPDVERVLADLLSAYGTCGTETPQNLQSEVPYIRLTRTGDAGSDRVTDRATVSIDVFAANADDAKNAAGQIRQLLLWGLPAETDHGQLDWGRLNTGPSLLPPTDSDNLRLVTSGYTVSMRRTPQ